MTGSCWPDRPINYGKLWEISLVSLSTRMVRTPSGNGSNVTFALTVVSTCEAKPLGGCPIKVKMRMPVSVMPVLKGRSSILVQPAVRAVPLTVMTAAAGVFFSMVMSTESTS